MPHPMPPLLSGIGEVADRFAGFILDQWGVLHDGQRPYPGVVEALGELRRRAKRVVLLSNSGRRAEHSRRHLAAIGLPTALFDRIVTSGETAWQILAERRLAPFDRLGRRCLLITRDDDREVVEGTGCTIVGRAEEADFLFVGGVDSPQLGLEDYRPTLEAALRRGLPMLCSNPDRLAPSQGTLILAPGALADFYVERGGEVHFVGKPHRPIYLPCLDALDGLERHELLAVGDSLEHDIGGANALAIPAALVTSGLHAAELGEVGPDASGLDLRLATLAGTHGGSPDYLLRRFAW